ncbi:expressed unknown protein [Seminavis robusta]|uniref:Uncharacterized protein n=1 Tax=Seminavis robusta TaxID=568900 RepID=A0A9N8E8F0_9STRA|nr:expressed unknown protein [Seminavis robusta]|eukprot:Sro734_g194700.1 n/a (405) ;mRNA; r:28854-30236
MSTPRMIRLCRRRGVWLPRRQLSSINVRHQQPQWTPPPPPTSPAIVSTNPVALPFLHSRKKLAPACLDPSELKDHTDKILQTAVGDLIPFPRHHGTLDRSTTDEGAWTIGENSVQQVEYLMRGHAAQIPGTLWQGWSNSGNGDTSGSSSDPLTCLEAMDALLERMAEEGTYYMQEDGVYDDDDDDLMLDFASPGATVNMYDIFLDSLAVTAEQVGDPRQFSARKASNLLTARHAFDVFELLYQRHSLDGGEESNDNKFTLPTQISYNAVLRTVANLHFDGQSEVHRDLALMVAFSTDNAMQQSKTLERNSATFAYLLQVIAKYIPACEFRGNVAHALWMQAKSSGVYNDQVMDAYFQAHEPSNSARHDEWLEKNLKGFDWRTEVPQRWRRRVQKYRMVPKQTTY